MTGARRPNVKEPVVIEDQTQIEAEENEGGPIKEPVVVESAEVPGWHPSAPCLKCGAVDYRITVGWGNGCDKCLFPEED
jgi:hypothetical protein